MADRRIVGQGKSLGIENPNLASETLQQAAGFVGEKPTIGDLPD
jgi:hypothetical protein